MLGLEATVDVTIVVNGHSEGLLAHPTWRALDKALLHAQESGLAIEVIGVLDRPDATTARVFSDSIAACSARVTQLITVDCGDPGLARNAGVGSARGGIVGFLDGDDLVTPNWITAACSMLTSSDSRSIIHPEFVVRFGGETTQVTPVWPSTDPRMRVENLVDHNYWVSTCLAPIEVFRRYPFPATDPESVWGDEDWIWNIVTCDAGIEHLTAPDTALFYRQESEGSLAQEYVKARTLRPRLEFFTSEERAATVSEEARCGGEEVPPNQSSVELSATILDHWRELHVLDPWLEYPSPEHLLTFEWDHAPIHGGLSLASAVWWQLVSALASAKPDVMIFAPWLRLGGADRQVVAYAETITRLCPNSRVVVFTTGGASTHAHLLPAHVTFVDIFSMPGYTNLRRFKRARLIATLVTQYRPHTVHVINSPQGFNAVEFFPRAMAASSRVFLSAYAVDRLESGERCCHLFRRPVEYLDKVESVLVDSSAFADTICELIGWDRKKFVVHRQPIPAPEPRTVSARSGGSPLRVVWAARFDREKQLGMVARIAEACLALGLKVEWHVYGSQVTGTADGLAETLGRLRELGVQIHRPFRQFGDLPLQELDLFLMTSEYEGIPWTLLEAMAHSLPVMAPSVGGIPEVLTEETGWPIASFDDLDGYVKAIQSVIAGPGEAQRRAANALVKVQREFSLPAHERQLMDTTNYLPCRPD